MHNQTPSVSVRVPACTRVCMAHTHSRVLLPRTGAGLGILLSWIFSILLNFGPRAHLPGLSVLLYPHLLAGVTQALAAGPTVPVTPHVHLQTHTQWPVRDSSLNLKQAMQRQRGPTLNSGVPPDNGSSFSSQLTASPCW